MRRRTTDLPRCRIFQSERDARAWLESMAWKDGPVCPHCGHKGRGGITRLRGRSHRAGLFQCNSSACRRQFTVATGTALENSRIPIRQWLAALFLITSAGVRVPVTHVHRALAIPYKTAWFMVHRLRTAMVRNDQNAAHVLSAQTDALQRMDGYLPAADQRAAAARTQGVTRPKSRSSYEPSVPNRGCKVDRVRRKADPISPRLVERHAISDQPIASRSAKRESDWFLQPQPRSAQERVPDEIRRWQELGISGPVDDPLFRKAAAAERLRWRIYELEITEEAVRAYRPKRDLGAAPSRGKTKTDKR